MSIFELFKTSLIALMIFLLAGGLSPLPLQAEDDMENIDSQKDQYSEELAEKDQDLKKRDDNKSDDDDDDEGEDEDEDDDDDEDDD